MQCRCVRGHIEIEMFASDYEQIPISFHQVVIITRHESRDVTQASYLLFGGIQASRERPGTRDEARKQRPRVGGGLTEPRGFGSQHPVSERAKLHLVDDSELIWAASPQHRWILQQRYQSNRKEQTGMPSTRLPVTRNQ